jgi:hypothetical protein
MMSSVTSKYAWSLSGTLSGRAAKVAVGEGETGPPLYGPTENDCFTRGVFRLRKLATLEDVRPSRRHSIHPVYLSLIAHHRATCLPRMFVYFFRRSHL